MQHPISKNKLSLFYIYYIVVFLGNALNTSFFSVFFKNAGMNDAVLGLLFGIAPCVGFIFQPIWGNFADKAKTKNLVLSIVILGVLMCIALFYITVQIPFDNRTYLLCILSLIMVLFTAFNNALTPLQDTITLDYISKSGTGNYGFIRMSGTISFTIMAALAGFILAKNQDMLFPLYFIIMCLTFTVAQFIPKAHGYRSKTEKGSVSEILQNREIRLMLLLIMVQYIGIAFSNTYNGPYMLSLGGNNAFVGLASALMAFAEIPFHLGPGRKFIQRIGIHKSLLIGLVAGIFRWGICSCCHSKWILLLTALLQGIMFVPMAVGVVEYINSKVPPRLKATGQTALTLFSVVIARSLANIGGGLLIALFDQIGFNGIKSVYATLVPVYIFTIIFVSIPLIKYQKEHEV